MANFATIVARGENIVIHLSTDMGPRFLIQRRGDTEKGETGTFLFLHTWRRGRLRPRLPRATSWQRCSCPPFRAPDAHLRGDCRVRTAVPACATHPAHLCPAFLVTATVPQGAPSRRCTLAASSQTRSSAERRPAHPGELVRLAHGYRRLPSLRPLGKRCRLVSLIFCPFFSLGRC